MKISHRKGLIDRESFVAQYLSLAFLTIGIASTLGSDDLLAAFAAGTQCHTACPPCYLRIQLSGSAVSCDGHVCYYRRQLAVAKHYLLDHY